MPTSEEVELLRQDFTPDEDEIDYEKITGEAFRRAMPFAAASIIDTALYGTDPKLKFQAATYVVDRGLGTTAKVSGTSRPNAPLDRFMRTLGGEREAQGGVDDPAEADRGCGRDDDPVEAEVVD